MKPIEIGEAKFKLWVHRGSQLEQCTALRLSANFMKNLLERAKQFKWKFGVNKIAGRLQFHGEKRVEKTEKNSKLS